MKILDLHDHIAQTRRCRLSCKRARRRRRVVGRVAVGRLRASVYRLQLNDNQTPMLQVSSHRWIARAARTRGRTPIDNIFGRRRTLSHSHTLWCTAAIGRLLDIDPVWSLQLLVLQLGTSASSDLHSTATACDRRLRSAREAATSTCERAAGIGDIDLQASCLHADLKLVVSPLPIGWMASALLSGATPIGAAAVSSGANGDDGVDDPPLPPNERTIDVSPTATSLESI